VVLDARLMVTLARSSESFHLVGTSGLPMMWGYTRRSALTNTFRLVLGYAQRRLTQACCGRRRCLQSWLSVSRVRDALKKWALLVVHTLSPMARRARRSCDGRSAVSRKDESDPARLERNGFVSRRLSGSTSAGQYSLTALGASLSEPITTLTVGSKTISRYRNGAAN
jgi:hypothetical protein